MEIHDKSSCMCLEKGKRGKECLFARKQKNVGLKFASAEKDVCAQRR